MQSMQSVQEALSSRRSGLAQCILFLVKYAKYASMQEAMSRPCSGLAQRMFLGETVEVCGRPHNPTEMG